MLDAVGRSVPRKDGIGKATGEARYADDLRFPGMLLARTIRSTIPCGRLIGARLELGAPGFTVVDHRDIPGSNVVALITDDQPCLVEREIRHIAEPVLLLAHESAEALLGAQVMLDEEPGEPVYDPERSPISFKTILIEKGELDAGFAAAAHVIEGTYRTGHQEHVYIEPQGVIAVPEDGGITVYGSIQCPYYVHSALTVLLGDAVGHVRVVQTETGGGFGGKEEYPSMLAGHAALLALKAGRPVKLVYDRSGGHARDDQAASLDRAPPHRGLPRRPARSRWTSTSSSMAAPTPRSLPSSCRAAPFMPPARIAAPTCGSRLARCSRTRRRTERFADSARRRPSSPSKCTWSGSPRRSASIRCGCGSGTSFAPATPRRPGSDVHEDCSALEVLRTAVRRSGFRRKRKAYAGTKRGIGLALFWHGSGFTGSGELKLASRATVELTGTGARVLTSSTEIGQGTRTMHAQIVADALGIPYEQVEVRESGHERGPGQRADRRVAHLHGRGEDPRNAPQRSFGRSWATSAPTSTTGEHGPLSVTKQYEQPAWIRWDDVTYRGDAYATYAWGCNVVEVELDTDTWEVRPAAAHRRGGCRQGDSPGAGQGADRGRHRRRGWATRCWSAW